MNRSLRLLVAVALSAVSLVGCTGKYVRETNDVPVVSTPERIARGQYVVDHLAACGACHTSRASLMEGESAEGYLAGGNILSDQGMRLWVPNLTPDTETGLGRWTDDQILRGIREGVSADGSLQVPLMPYHSYRFMSDEDAESVVAFLRSVPPVKQTKPRIENELPFAPGFARSMGLLHEKPVRHVPTPDLSTPLQRGEYVMKMGHCWQCHSLGKTGPKDFDDDEFMAGADLPIDIGLGKVWASNLTPHEKTGLGGSSAEVLAESLRTGTMKNGKQMSPPMSWFVPHLSGLAPEDMEALVAYLKALPPVEKAVPPRELNADGKKLVGE